MAGARPTPDDRTMETLTAPACAADGPDSGRERALRIARLKFVALPAQTSTEALGPAARHGPGVGSTRAGARFLALLRRIASRVIGRPAAARP